MAEFGWAEFGCFFRTGRLKNIVKKLFQATAQKLSPSERSEFAKEVVQDGETEIEKGGGDSDLATVFEEPTWWSNPHGGQEEVP